MAVNSEQQKDFVDVQKSKCISFTAAGGCDKIAVTEEMLVEPKEDEVRVGIKFAGVNFIDILKKIGIYPKELGGGVFPMIAGCEGSGIIEAVGSKVNTMDSDFVKGSKHDFKKGDRVLILHKCGMFRQTVYVPPHLLIKIPDNMSFEDAAALPLNYSTAYDLLFRMCRLKKGDVILLPQAAGGVGTAVLQLAKTLPDVKVIAICSKSKHGIVAKNGADHMIDYHTQIYADEVRKLYPKGVDVILDGLNGEDSKIFFDLLAPFGRVVYYGTANMASEDNSFFKKAKAWWNCFSTNSLKIIPTNKSVAGYHLGVLHNPSRNEVDFTWPELFDLHEKGVIKPMIDSIFPFDKAHEAFERMLKRKNVGKILLSPEITEAKIITPEQ